MCKGVLQNDVVTYKIFIIFYRAKKVTIPIVILASNLLVWEQNVTSLEKE